MIFATGNTPRLYVSNSGISFSSKLLCTFTVSGSDYVAEFRNNNANSYGVQIKEPSSVNNGYPLLAVDTNSGASHFRVDSGTGNIYANAGTGTGRLAYMCRAWASFTQTGTQTFRGSKGFSSHNDLGVGYTKFTLSVAQPDTNYSIVCSGTAGDTSSGYASLDTISGGGTGTNGQYLQSTGTGIQWVTLSVSPDSISAGNSNVTVANNSNITLQTAGGNTATYDTSGNLTIPGTLTAGDLSVTTGFVKAQLKESVEDSASGISGNFNFDLANYQVYHYRGDATSDFTVNFRFDGSTNLTSKVVSGESVTATLITKNGGTARKLNDIQIDGNGITERYLGGFGAPTGTANAWDVYTFTLIKDDGGGWNAYISYNYYTT